MWLRAHFLLLGGSLAFCLYDQRQTRGGTQPFELNSTSSTYPFVMRLVGTMERHTTHYSCRSVMARSPAKPPDLANQGLATHNVAVRAWRGGGWGWGCRIRQASRGCDSLPAGGTRNVVAMRFVVTGVDTVPMKERWLVAELSVVQSRQVWKPALVSYACAPDNLAGPTPASRERAQDGQGLLACMLSRSCPGHTDVCETSGPRDPTQQPPGWSSGSHPRLNRGADGQHNRVWPESASQPLRRMSTELTPSPVYEIALSCSGALPPKVVGQEESAANFG
jgi:hypothetical protein